jgi:hypothetical protein
MNHGWPLRDDVLRICCAVIFFLAFPHVEFMVF